MRIRGYFYICKVHKVRKVCKVTVSSTVFISSFAAKRSARRGL